VQILNLGWLEIAVVLDIKELFQIFANAIVYLAFLKVKVNQSFDSQFSVDV